MPAETTHWGWLLWQHTCIFVVFDLLNIHIINIYIYIYMHIWVWLFVCMCVENIYWERFWFLNLVGSKMQFIQSLYQFYNAIHSVTVAIHSIWLVQISSPFRTTPTASWTTFSLMMSECSSFLFVYIILYVYLNISLYIYIHTQFLCIMKKNTHDFQGFPISTMNTYPGDAKVTCEKSLVFQVTQPQNRFTLMMLLMPLTKMTPHSFRQTKGRKNNSLLGDSFVENRRML